MIRPLLLLLTVAATLCAADARRFVVLTFNIHHGEGTDKNLDLERIARVIRSVSPDLVALQEVDRRTTRTGGVDQLAELARLTGMTGIFGKSMDYGGGEYGNGVLYRSEGATHTLFPLPGAEPRSVLILDVGAVRFAATHWDARDPNARLASAEQANEWAVETPMPALYAGDLNAVRSSAPIQKLLEEWTIAGPEIATIPSESPRRQIDFVAFRPAARWRVIHVRAVTTDPAASDHLPLVATLELLP